MANSFGISLKQDIAAAVVKIDANTALITTIDDIVDAIKLKTDATPQNVRSYFESIGFNTESSSFVPLLNITGAGILYKLGIALVDAGDTLELKVTIDSYVSEILSLTGDVLNHIVIPTIQDPGSSTLYLMSFEETGNETHPFNLEFNSNLKIEFRRSLGTGGYVYCKALYGYDAY